MHGRGEVSFFTRAKTDRFNWAEPVPGFCGSRDCGFERSSARNWDGPSSA
jgi:hypothetical protein